MREMLPLLVVVAVFALIAYLTITGAVRKYRRYLDSGQDYKQLLQSMRRLEDLQDESQIRALSHPELRNFLLNARTRLLEREKELDKRAAELEASVGGAEKVETLAADTDVLVSAIMSGGGFGQDLAISVPELKRVEIAVREHLIGKAADESKERLEGLRASVTESTSALRDMLAEIREELTATERSARELESDVGSLRGQAATTAPAAAGGADASIVIGRLDSISEVLKSLGEETRSVAINTALQASSTEASGESVIKLADDVRDVAAKYNGVVSQWAEASEAARRAITASAGAGSSLRVGESIESLSSKVGLWVERTVILAEKLKSFERHFNEAFADLDARPAETAGAGDSWELETTGTPPRALGTEEMETPTSDEFEYAGTSSSFDLDAPAAEHEQAVDTTGFVKQEAIFSEGAPADADTEIFADIPAADEAAAAPSDVTPPEAPQPEAAPPVVNEVLETTDASFGEFAPEPQPFDDKGLEPEASDEFEVTDAQREYVIDDDPLDQSSAIEDVIAGPNLTGGDPPAEEDVIDLYELGAVDYEPENVHHNA